MATSYPLKYQNPFNTGSRPYLALHVTGPTGKYGPIVGLVDSGADRTCLPSGFAPLMGYTGQDLEQHQGEQVGGSMTLWVAKKPATAFVVGLPQITFELWPSFVQGSQVPWGRNDFFKVFSVMVDETNQTFTLIRP